jgi:outer membrane protein, heavy metal efflux system
MTGGEMRIKAFMLVMMGALGATALGQSASTPAKQDPAMSCMAGMSMPGCPQTDASPHKSTEHEMPGMDEMHSHGQHDVGTMQMSMPQQDSDIGMDLQEPKNLPAPELLKEVGSRSAMSLEDFMRSADVNNPTLKQANALVRRSQEQARQAGLYPNPSVGYQGEQIRGGSFGGGEQGGFVQQTVVLGGKLGLRRNTFEQEKRSDQIGVEEQTYRVHADIQQAFYDALTAQANVHLRQQLLGVAMDAVETVHQLANVGQADAPDILQTEVETEQAKIDYANAQREYLQAFRMLAAIAGKSDLPVSPLKGELEKTPDLNSEEMVNSVITNSPTIKRAQQEIAVAQSRLKEAKREPVPDLQLRAGAQYNGEQVSQNPTKSTGAQSFATAGINIPLWNRNQGNIEAAKVEIERAEQEVLREQLSLRQQTAPLAQSYESAKFEAERYKTQLIPRAARAYELYLKKYNSMAQAYPQVLVSQRTLFQLQVSYLMALHDVWSNAIALENYALSGGLQAPMSSGSQTTTINLPNTNGGQE